MLENLIFFQLQELSEQSKLIFQNLQIEQFVSNFKKY
jgi:hypothetical protein